MLTNTTKVYTAVESSQCCTKDDKSLSPHSLLYDAGNTRTHDLTVDSSDFTPRMQTCSFVFCGVIVALETEATVALLSGGCENDEQFERLRLYLSTPHTGQLLLYLEKGRSRPGQTLRTSSACLRIVVTRIWSSRNVAAWSDVKTKTRQHETRHRHMVCRTPAPAPKP